MKTIEEKNRMIAEFMGAVQAYKPYVNEELCEYDMLGILECIGNDENDQNYFLPEQMLFNTSWDWLMPVVEKIEYLLPDDSVISIEYKDCRIPVNKCEFDIVATGGTKLEASYVAVVEFIEWYNKNK